MSWTDPDIKNHVKGSNSLTISAFMDSFLIVDEDVEVNNTYKLKKDDTLPTMKMYNPTLNKLNDVITPYIDSFKTEDKDSKYVSKPMRKSYAEYNRVELYQLFLAFNDVYMAAEFENSTDARTIQFPKDSTLTKIFSDILTEKSCPSVKELTSEEQVQELESILSSSVDAEQTVSKFANEKIYIETDEATEKFENPIINTYLVNTFIGSSSSDESKQKMLSKMLNEITRYEKIND